MDVIQFVDNRRDVIGYAQLDWRVALRSLELLAKLAARCAVERRLHVVLEVRVGDVEPRLRHAGYSGEAAMNEARQRVPILIGKLLEDDQPRSQRTRVLHDGAPQGPGSGSAR